MDKNGLKTFNEMSKDCKVSRQTIYNLVKDLEKQLQKEGAGETLPEYIVKIDNVKRLTTKGQEYIYKRLDIPTDRDKEQSEAEQEQSDFKSKYITMLEEQIKIKDDQIRGLNIAIEEMQSRHKEANILQAMKLKQLEANLEEITKEKEPGFFRSLLEKIKANKS